MREWTERHIRELIKNEIAKAGGGGGGSGDTYHLSTQTVCVNFDPKPRPPYWHGNFGGKRYNSNIIVNGKQLESFEYLHIEYRVDANANVMLQLPNNPYSQPQPDVFSVPTLVPIWGHIITTEEEPYETVNLLKGVGTLSCHGHCEIKNPTGTPEMVWKGNIGLNISFLVGRYKETTYLIGEGADSFSVIPDLPDEYEISMGLLLNN